MNFPGEGYEYIILRRLLLFWLGLDCIPRSRLEMLGEGHGDEIREKRGGGMRAMRVRIGLAVVSSWGLGHKIGVMDIF